MEIVIYVLKMVTEVGGWGIGSDEEEATRQGG